MHVQAGDQDVPFTCKLTTASGTRAKNDMLFEKNTVTFLASAKQTTLTFLETDNGDGTGWGCVLDDVSVVVSDKSESLLRVLQGNCRN